jgi:tRNA-Thr(GGU) m(6)t(6)A37 methyltransferase TsaA
VDTTLEPIGHVTSPLRDVAEAPKHEREGAPDAWVVVRPDLVAGLGGLSPGDEVVLLTWLHRAARDVTSVRPRGDRDRPERGVFSTRSPARPNPIGLHQVRILEVRDDRIHVDALEAIDGTPVLDIKPVRPSGAVLPEPRDRHRRTRDTRHRLDHDVDLWLATADPGSGTPWLVPLSFDRDGEALLVATSAHSRSGRNLQANPRVRIGLGETRDVVMVDGDASVLDPAEVPDATADRFAARTGFDPRELEGYLYVRIVPRRIQAWREVNEIEDRQLMRDGRWLAP